MDPRVIVVAAVAENNVIGSLGKLPWSLKSDLQRFKTLTEGGVVVMGRHTYESILDRLGHALERRVNVVLTRGGNAIRVSDELVIARSFADVLRWYPDRTLFVIGGAEVYRESLPLAAELHVTLVHARPYGDAYFPSLHTLGLEQCETRRFAANPAAGDQYDFTFTVFRRPDEKTTQGFVYLPNAREPRQWATMERIQLDGVCPFCPEHRSRYHRKPVMAQTDRWTLTENQWPYPNTRIHLLAIHRSHVERLAELDDEDWSQLGILARFAEKFTGVPSGGLGLRFGDPAGNGGTVRHLHAQLLSADVTDPADPAYRKVRLGLS
jgi:dihydrofolate reductase